MSAPLVVSDWIVVSPDGTFVKEGKSSVLRMTSILAPRKEFHQYKVGEEVKAKFCGKEYRAEIIAIGSTGKYRNIYFLLFIIAIKKIINT